MGVVDENPYLPPIDASKPAQRRRKVNWPLIVIAAWFVVAALAIGCRLLFALTGTPMGEP
jgi:hypothetical protein